MDIESLLSTENTSRESLETAMEVTQNLFDDKSLNAALFLEYSKKENNKNTTQNLVQLFANSRNFSELNLILNKLVTVDGNSATFYFDLNTIDTLIYHAYFESSILLSLESVFNSPAIDTIYFEINHPSLYLSDILSIAIPIINMCQMRNNNQKIIGKPYGYNNVMSLFLLSVCDEMVLNRHTLYQIDVNVEYQNKWVDYKMMNEQLYQIARDKNLLTKEEVNKLHDENITLTFTAEEIYNRFTK